MNQPELYLKREEEESWLDAHERELLEDKKFFTSRPIIEKVFRARLSKMERRREAFLELAPEDAGVELETNTKVWPDYAFSSTSIKDAFAEYHRFKMHWQLLVFQCFSVIDLMQVVEKGMEFHRNWLMSLQIPANFHDEATLLSKAPDPSVLQEALNNLALKGGKGIGDVLHLDFDQKETLIWELKRLSLQLEKEK